MQATGNNQNQSYSLSIRLYADGFSFYSYSPNAGQAIREERHTVKEGQEAAEVLRQALATSELTHSTDYMAVYILVSGPSMQVPLEAFRKEEAAMLYRLTFAKETTGKIYYNILPHLEIAKVFDVDRDTEKVLCTHFPTLRFYHSDTMLLEKIALSDTPDKTRLYVHFYEQEMSVFRFRNQHLLYANTFPADQAENAAFFILSVWKNLEMEAQTDECTLLGDNRIKSDTAQLLARYLGHVNDLPRTELFRRSALAQHPSIPFDLLALLANVI